MQYQQQPYQQGGYPQQPQPPQQHAAPQPVGVHLLPQVWEYMVLEKLYDPQKKLNELGAQGWELVAIDSAPTAKMGSRYVLKRPKR